MTGASFILWGVGTTARSRTSDFAQSRASGVPGLDYNCTKSSIQIRSSIHTASAANLPSPGSGSWRRTIERYLNPVTLVRRRFLPVSRRDMRLGFLNLLPAQVHAGACFFLARSSMPASSRAASLASVWVHLLCCSPPAMLTRKHGDGRMTYRETQSKVHEMSSADVASGYVRRMVENETRGWGDQDNALARLEAKYGLPFWTLQNLRTGRAKTVEASLFNRIKAAFVDQCGRHAARLLHEAEMAKAGNPDVDVAAIEDQIRALASRLAAAKGKTERRA